MNGRKAEYPLGLAAEHANRRLQQVDDEGNLYNIRSQAQLGPQDRRSRDARSSDESVAAALPDDPRIRACSWFQTYRTSAVGSAKDWTQMSTRIFDRAA